MPLLTTHPSYPEQGGDSQPLLLCLSLYDPLDCTEFSPEDDAERSVERGRKPDKDGYGDCCSCYNRHSWSPPLTSPQPTITAVYARTVVPSGRALRLALKPPSRAYPGILRAQYTTPRSAAAAPLCRQHGSRRLTAFLSQPRPLATRALDTMMLWTVLAVSGLRRGPALRHSWTRNGPGKSSNAAGHL